MATFLKMIYRAIIGKGLQSAAWISRGFLIAGLRARHGIVAVPSANQHAACETSQQWEMTPSMMHYRGDAEAIECRHTDFAKKKNAHGDGRRRTGKD